MKTSTAKTFLVTNVLIMLFIINSVWQLSHEPQIACDSRPPGEAPPDYTVAYIAQITASIVLIALISFLSYRSLGRAQQRTTKRWLAYVPVALADVLLLAVLIGFLIVTVFVKNLCFSG